MDEKTRVAGIPAAVLKAHYLTGIECDHEAKTDVATCWCGRWRSEPQPSVGAAVDRWIEHVMEHAAPSLKTATLEELERATDIPSNERSYADGIEDAARAVETQRWHSDFSLSHEGGGELMAAKIRKLAPGSVPVGHIQAPSAYLLTGSRVFEDSVVRTAEQAATRAASRNNDGTTIVPLYRADSAPKMSLHDARDARRWRALLEAGVTYYDPAVSAAPALAGVAKRGDVGVAVPSRGRGPRP